MTILRAKDTSVTITVEDVSEYIQNNLMDIGFKRSIELLADHIVINYSVTLAKSMDTAIELMSQWIMEKGVNNGND